MNFTIRGLIKVGVMMAACNAAVAQQTVEFNTLNSQDGYNALAKGRAQYTDKINGVFTRPRGVIGNVPVMVIMHSSAGNSQGGTGVWADFFLERGVATFVVDSFTPRGIKESSTDQGVLSEAGTTVDALMALQALSTMPGVDPKRIGVIGFSRGGIAAVHTSFSTLLAKVFGPNSDLKFALNIAFYPTCTRFGQSNGQPLLMLMGDRDDNHPMFLCNSFVDKMREKGANLKFVVYPGATHGFDIDRKPYYAAKAQSWKTCTKDRKEDLDTLTFTIDGEVVTAKQYVEYSQSCRTSGINVGPDRFGASDSRKQVEQFVRKNFAM